MTTKAAYKKSQAQFLPRQTLLASRKTEQILPYIIFDLIIPPL